MSNIGVVPRRLPTWVALTGAVVVGVLTAVQARINGQLGRHLDDGFVAAVVSFGSGLVILVIASVALPAGRRGLVALTRGVRSREIPWWMLAGGAAGALTVATQGLAVAVIGVALFTVGVVAGQAVCGLVLDRLGHSPAGAVAVTVPRVVGGVIALGAVAIALVGDGVAGVPWWMLAMPLAAGMGIAWQQATNGRLRLKVGTPLTATFVNFVGGTLVLAVAATIHVSVVGAPAPAPSDPSQYWLYLGGVLGVVYIFLAAALVQYTGVLLFGLGSVVGQLASSVVLDAVWPAPSSPGLVQEITMVALATISVIVAAAPWQRRNGQRRTGRRRTGRMR